MLRLQRFAVLGLVVVLNAYAIDDERVINEMMRTSSLTAEQIRAEYKDGCASGAHDGMLICNSFQYTAADLELNDRYKQLLRQLTTQQARAKLIRAQKAWVTFRDLTCAYETDGYVASRDWSSVNFSCMTRITLERNSELAAYLKCSDPGCPGEW